MKKLMLTVCVLFSISGLALANGSHGQYFEKQDGEYTLGVGTDVFTLVAEDAVRFDFNLSRTEPPERLEFSDAWVRIVEKRANSFDKTVFAGGLHYPEFGYTGMTYIFPNSGEYVMTVRFNKTGESITTDVAFPMTVEAGEPAASKPGLNRDIMNLGVGAGIGALVVVFVSLFRRKKK